MGGGRGDRAFSSVIFLGKRVAPQSTIIVPEQVKVWYGLIQPSNATNRRPPVDLANKREQGVYHLIAIGFNKARRHSTQHTTSVKNLSART
jgi:hypothetical protein